MNTQGGSTMRRFIQWISKGCRLAILVVLASCWPAYSAGLTNLPAPDFALKDINGNTHQLSSLRDRPMVVLYFFDADSKPSHDGLISLNQLCAKYRQADLEVWAITKSAKADIDRFIPHTPIDFPILIDNGTVSQNYKADRILPTTCILGPDLKVMDLLHGGGKSSEIMLVRLAQRSLQHRKSDFAQAISETVMQSNPESISARVVNAYAALDQGKLDKSESGFKQLAGQGGEAQAAGNEGLSYVALQKGQAQKALSLAEKVEQTDPSRGLANVIKAEVFYSQNKKQAAESEYQKAIDKKNTAPHHRAKAYNQLARIRSNQGRLQESESLYRKAVAIDPYYIEATANQGLIHEKAGRFDLALASYNKALSIDKKDMFSLVLQKKLLAMVQLEQDSKEKNRIDRLVKDLAARYRKRQQQKKETVQDSWTSRPMVLSFINFTETGGLPVRDGFSTVLTAQLAETLNASGRVRVVERVVVDKLLQELNVGSSELADPATALELGKVLSAKLISTGSLYYFNENYLLTMRLVDTETTHIAKVITDNIPGTGSAQNDVHRLNRKILTTIIEKYPLQAYVVRVENDEVMVNLGAGQGVVPGTKFDIIEPGVPVRYRGKELKGKPKVIGQVEIVNVDADFCQGRIVQNTRPIVQDDKLLEKVIGLTRSKT
jgi:tetratricopeptide (TPR) repeat protein